MIGTAKVHASLVKHKRGIQLTFLHTAFGLFAIDAAERLIPLLHHFLAHAGLDSAACGSIAAVLATSCEYIKEIK